MRVVANNNCLGTVETSGVVAHLTYYVCCANVRLRIWAFVAIPDRCAGARWIETLA